MGQMTEHRALLNHPFGELQRFPDLVVPTSTHLQTLLEPARIDMLVGHLQDPIDQSEFLIQLQGQIFLLKPGHVVTEPNNPNFKQLVLKPTDRHIDEITYTFNLNHGTWRLTDLFQFASGSEQRDAWSRIIHLYGRTSTNYIADSRSYKGYLTPAIGRKIEVHLGFHEQTRLGESEDFDYSLELNPATPQASKLEIKQDSRGLLVRFERNKYVIAAHLNTEGRLIRPYSEDLSTFIASTPFSLTDLSSPQAFIAATQRYIGLGFQRSRFKTDYSELSVQPPDPADLV